MLNSKTKSVSKIPNRLDGVRGSVSFKTGGNASPSAVKKKAISKKMRERQLDYHQSIYRSMEKYHQQCLFKLDLSIQLLPGRISFIKRMLQPKIITNMRKECYKELMSLKSWNKKPIMIIMKLLRKKCQFHLLYLVQSLLSSQDF